MTRHDFSETLLDVGLSSLGVLAVIDIIKDVAGTIIVILSLAITIHRFRKTFKKKNEKNVNDSGDNSPNTGSGLANR